VQQRVKDAGFLVVGDSIQPSEIPNPFWKVAKGQVIDPKNMKPVVGDYDLMGVFPRSSPGVNMGLVASGGESVKNVTNPYVERFIKAVNAKLDMPRLLHGAQDQVDGFRGGVIFFFDDGTNMLLENEAEVETFYNLINRKTRGGSYN
jgi:hypothetical protein